MHTLFSFQTISRRMFLQCVGGVLGITEDNTKDKARDKGYNARDNALYYRLGLQCFRKVLGVFLKYVCNVLEMFWGCVCNVVGMRFQCCKIGF